MHTYLVLPSAAEVFDDCYAAKLPYCALADWCLGLHPAHPYSAVNWLTICYEVRRPFFEVMDQGISMWFQIARTR